jgi:hypothetical protein
MTDPAGKNYQDKQATDEGRARPGHDGDSTARAKFLRYLGASR